jgi:hypothetical protein
MMRTPEEVFHRRQMRKLYACAVVWAAGVGCVLYWLLQRP